MRDESLSEAVKILGGNAAVARIFDITREAVGQWDRCPAERVLRLSDATEGKIKPWELRPDLYREPTAEQARAL